MVFGIDLGTTYSCIAALDDSGVPTVLKNAEGSLTTPSVVYFESPTSVIVGDSAKESAVLFPSDVVQFIKRQIGKPGFSRKIQGSEMKPEEISAYILKKLVQDGEAELRAAGRLGAREHVTDAVITCPAYFGIGERMATEAAGKIAGLNVLSIINEPTAAAISYGVLDADADKTLLVFDLGGGTFDITVIRIKSGNIQVICTGGDDILGGRDWDERIMMYLAEQFQQETGIDDDIMEDMEVLQALGLEAERAKKLLSTKEMAPVTVRYADERARIELTREKFEELTESLLVRCIDFTNDVLDEAKKKGVSRLDISEILLVGGSTRMPQIARRLKDAFSIPVRMYDPDEAVAKGAAIYAGRLQGGQKKHGLFSLSGSTANKQKIVNVTSRSFGKTVMVGENYDHKVIQNVIKKNTELPASNTITNMPVHDNQPGIRFTVYESLSSEDKLELDLGKSIGDVYLELPENTPNTAKIFTTFTLDEAGLLHVTSRLDGGGQVEAYFQTESNMSEAEVAVAIQRSTAISIS